MSLPPYLAKPAKRRWRLLPWSALTPIVDAMRVGAAKYGTDNWRQVPASEFENALLRHLQAYLCGVLTDDETDLPHLALAGANVLILLAKHQQELHGPLYEVAVAQTKPPEKALALIASHEQAREQGVAG